MSELIFIFKRLFLVCFVSLALILVQGFFVTDKLGEVREAPRLSSVKTHSNDALA